MFARTDRLLLRPGWPEDAPALAAAIGEECIVRNLARAPWPYGVEEARSYLATGFAELKPSFLIVTPADGRLIGGIGLDVGHGAAELGYWLASTHWNRGYATEAGRAVLAIARDALRLRRIVSGHFVDNPASSRVLEKLGFRPSSDAPATRRSVARGEDVPFKGYSLELA